MSVDRIGEWRGTPMATDEVDELLRTQGYGVLSLADGGDAYGLPVSFGYDGGERVFFVFLEVDTPHEKSVYAEATGTANLLVTDIRGRFDWRSVNASGPLRRVDPASEEWEDLLDAIDDNAWFSSVYARSESLEGIEGWVLEIEDITGLEKRQN